MSSPSRLARISDYVSHHAEHHGERPALIGSQSSLTYAELHAAVEGHTRALWAAGVRPGDRVALMSTPCPEFVVSYLATARLGAVWLGLNPRYTTRELAYVLSDARPRLVLSTVTGPESWTLAEAVTEALDDIVVQVSGLGDLRDLAGAAAYDETRDGPALATALDDVRTEDPALIVYTSGSTGAPKGALIRHSGLVRLGAVQSTSWDMERPVMLCNLPINHIGCVGDLVSVPLVAGGTIVLRESFDAEQVLRDIETHRITALFQIPTQLQRVSALPDFETRDLSSLTLVGWGGSPLPQQALSRFRERGCRLVATYGLTEATSSVSYTDPGATDEVLLHTVGRPDPGMDVRLLGADGTWVNDPDGDGEVCVRDRTVMAGYLGRPDETAAAFTADGWLRTGDIGRFRADGNLVLVGRSKDMFKSGGYNIYPREIESVLESHPDVRLVAVVARPDPDFHEVGVAYLQVAPGADVDESDLRDWARARLANFKVPKEFVLLDELPLLPVGKIDKPALRLAAAQQLTGSAHV